VLAAGAAFPDASLPDLQGAERRVAESWARGPALVVVGHADCGTTRLLLPCLERLHRRAGAGVALVLQDDPETARSLAAELGLTLPIRLDRDPYPFSAALDLTSVPTQHLVGGDGRVVRASQGFSREDLEGFARALGVASPLFGAHEEGPSYRPG
jgi:hypothetical protein